ncbi:GNAT family N-acetyltransferase [Chamaesiphon sp.]|uniref:GNAT family N-acetyltransferase n=1 Tax=Chamaesiphon sp. TaxID=2814140 RepID=UPI0035935C21
MLAQVISPLELEWQEYLNTIPHDFYHLPGYLQLEAKRQNATAEAIVIRNEAEVFFLPYLVRECHQLADVNWVDRDRIFDVISPYGYPGMLVSPAGQNPVFVKKCLNLIYEHWQQHHICSAFIRLHPILNSYIDSSMFVSDRSIPDRDLRSKLSPRGNVVVCDLTLDFNDIWKQIRSSYRHKINQLKRAGFIVRMVPVDKYLDVFIEIYLETMSRVNATKLYYFTRDYFEKLVQTLGDRIALCVVEVDNEVIAASLITEVSGIIQYHLGGTKTQYLSQSPTTIMLDYIIRWAKERNNQYLNLGGGLGGHQDSLYYFKSGFSDRVAPFRTIEAIVDRAVYDGLTHSRAKVIGMTLPEIQSTAFFPSYRIST